MKDNVTKHANAKRAEELANAPRKPSKADMQKSLKPVTLAPVEFANHKEPEAPKTEVPAVITPPIEGEVIQEHKPEEAKPKKARKWSSHHMDWKAACKVELKPEQRIYVVAENNPKKRDAKLRFELYRRGPEGMTVAEYCEAQAKSNLSHASKAKALLDIRWDQTANFIRVE